MLSRTRHPACWCELVFKSYLQRKTPPPSPLPPQPMHTTHSLSVVEGGDSYHWKGLATQFNFKNIVKISPEIVQFFKFCSTQFKNYQISVCKNDKRIWSILRKMFFLLSWDTLRSWNLVVKKIDFRFVTLFRSLDEEVTWQNVYKRFPNPWRHLEMKQDWLGHCSTNYLFRLGQNAETRVPELTFSRVPKGDCF